MTATILPLPAPAFLTGGPGYGEILLIAFVILLLFGPKRLPEIARMIGRTFDELRKASQDFKDQIMSIEDEARETTRTAVTAALGDDEEESDYYDDYEEDPDAGRGGDGQEARDEHDRDGAYEVMDDNITFQESTGAQSEQSTPSARRDTTPGDENANPVPTSEPESPVTTPPNPTDADERS